MSQQQAGPDQALAPAPGAGGSTGGTGGVPGGGAMFSRSLAPADASGADGAGASTPPESLHTGAARFVPRQTMIIVIVVVCTALMLTAMRRYGMGSGMTFAEHVKIDYDLDQRKIVGGEEEQKILSDLERSGQPVQIPPEAVRKNPFELGLEEPAAVVASGDAPIRVDTESLRRAEEARRAKESREKQIESAYRGLALHGVMAGRVPIARINGATVRVGDSVGEFFKVTKIERDRVELEADGGVFTLSMDDGGLGGN